MTGRSFRPVFSLPARTPLEERMKMITKGQASFPEPLLGMTCGQCGHFVQEDEHVSEARQQKGFGHCNLLTQHRTGARGKQIRKGLVACSGFIVEDTTADDL